MILFLFKLKVLLSCFTARRRRWNYVAKK